MSFDLFSNLLCTLYKKLIKAIVDDDADMTSDNIAFAPANCTEAIVGTSLEISTNQRRVSDALGMSINVEQPIEGVYTVGDK